MPVPSCASHHPASCNAARRRPRYCCGIAEDSDPTLRGQGGLLVSPFEAPPPPPLLNYQAFEQLTAYLTDDAPASVEKGVAGKAGTTFSRPALTSHEDGPPAGAADDGVERAPGSAAIGEQVGRPSGAGGAVARAGFSRSTWAFFLGGNIISTVVIVSQISLTAAFFGRFFIEENNAAEGEDGYDESECHSSSSNASLLCSFMMATLLFGLFTEVSFAIGLTLIYLSPLDIKSAHKIPRDDRCNRVASMMVNVFAPFSWGVIYTCGGIVGFVLATLPFCVGHGEAERKTYLFYSGVYMAFVGLKMLGVSFFMMFFSCGSRARCTDSCWAAVGKLYAHRMLSIAGFLDLFWQLQCAVWLYHLGAVGLVPFVILLLLGVTGELLSAFGSMELRVVGASVAPLPRPVASQSPDDAKMP